MRMLDNKPIASHRYNQGLYIPTNIKKVIQLNKYGGFFYRSGLEKKVMMYLDRNDKVIRWNCELIEIPYMLTEMRNNTPYSSQHRYYPDFYYEMQNSDGTIKKVVVEVKPESDIIPPKIPNNPTQKQIKNIRYSLEQYNKNNCKWASTVEFCKRHGMEFIILTDKMIEKMS